MARRKNTGGAGSKSSAPRLARFKIRASEVLLRVRPPDPNRTPAASNSAAATISSQSAAPSAAQPAPQPPVGSAPSAATPPSPSPVVPYVPLARPPMQPSQAWWKSGLQKGKNWLQKWKVPLSILALIVALGLAGFVLYRAVKLANETAPSPPPVVAGSPSPAPTTQGAGAIPGTAIAPTSSAVVTGPTATPTPLFPLFRGPGPRPSVVTYR